MRDRLIRALIRDEGMKLHAYQDTLGYWTIGVGRLIDRRRGGGITEGEAIALLENDIDRTEEALDRSLPWWRRLDAVRQEVMVNMAFNLGINGLLGFKNTLASIKAGLWVNAARGMRASRWARQTGQRAERLAVAMEKGQFDE